jgi:cytochrome c2
VTYSFFRVLAIAGAAVVLTTGSCLAAGDAAKGAKVFNKCKACHFADKDKNKVGPSLQGLFGRTAGSVEGYKYSDAMKGSGIVWSAETLAPFVRKPKDAVPGTKMAFAGLKKDGDVENLIAYLEEATKKPE